MTNRAVTFGTRWLIVDDDRSVVDAVRMITEARGHRCASAGTLAEASELWKALKPNVLLLDVALPDGTSIEWLSQIQDRHQSALVAMSGCASAWQGHQLGRLGVRAFLEKPFDEASLWSALEKARTPPDLADAVAACVGHLGLHDAEVTVRRSMIEEALRRTAHSRRGAARILSVSREMLQHALRKLAS
ncbi:MAG: response regulator [Myxococcota bacterium]